jgi:hypothetical protein
MMVNIAKTISISFCCKELYKAIVKHKLTLPDDTCNDENRVLMVPSIGKEINTCPFCKSKIDIEKMSDLHSDGSFAGVI